MAEIDKQHASMQTQTYVASTLLEVPNTSTHKHKQITSKDVLQATVAGLSFQLCTEAKGQKERDRRWKTEMGGGGETMKAHRETGSRRHK